MPGIIIPDPSGGLVGIHADNSGTWTKVTVDADGHLQVDILSSALPAGAATAANQSSILTELQQKLETGDLHLDASGDPQVDVLSSALPAGAATAANQSTMITSLQLLDDLQAALSTSGADQIRTDVISSNLPSGAATGLKQDTMITSLQLIDDLRDALASIALDQIRADIISSVLPTGASTSAKQDTMISSLALIDDLNDALSSMALDELRAEVVSSALPTGAATAANQATMITALQLIDDLQAALASVATDKLRVSVVDALPAGTNNIGDVDVATMPTTTVIPGSGEKLFGFSDTVVDSATNTNVPAGTVTLGSTTVPSGTVYVMSCASLKYTGTTPTRMQVQAIVDGTTVVVANTESPTSGVWVAYPLEILLGPGDSLRAVVNGATAGDDFRSRFLGYQLAAP